MSMAPQIALLAFAGVLPFYLHAFLGFYRLVKAEKPEWLSIRGAFRFLYGDDPLPRIGDPNVQVELLRIAFGSRARELRPPQALSYARRIRTLGIVGLLLFVVGVTGLLTGAP
jgi:hypothetical protein